MLHADESTPCKVVLCTQDSVQRSKRMDFDCWMRDVDKMFRRVFLLAASDFEDWTWMEAYDLGKTPEQAFDKWAEETGNSEFI